MAVSMNRSASSFARVARGLAETPGVLPTVQGIVDRAVEIVPCDWAIVAVTEQISPTPARISASTDPSLASVIAEIAGKLGSSPGIDAFTGGTTVVANDLASEARYAEYAREMVDRTGVRAVLSLGLRLSDAPVGVLSCYCAVAQAFDDAARMRAEVLAEHAVIAIEAARSDHRADNLEMALLRSRTIGAAMGILIERYRLRPDTAFSVLARLSQTANRKVGELAAELVETGEVEGLEARVEAERSVPAPQEASAPAVGQQQAG